MPEGNAAAVHMTELQKYYDELGIETIVATSACGRLDLGRKKLKKLIQAPNPWKRSNAYFLRTFGEIWAAIAIGIKIRFSIECRKAERVVVYSPSIFWSLSLRIAKLSSDKVRLIVRDIFPLWLLNAGLLQKSALSYKLLNWVAALQFKSTDRIYVQSSSDEQLIRKEYSTSGKQFYLLQTWMSKSSYKITSDTAKYIDPAKTNVLWLGNMGVAQNRDFVISVIAKILEIGTSVKFNIVGVKAHDRDVLKGILDKLDEHQRKCLEIIDYLTHEECAQLAIRSDVGMFSVGKQTTDGNVPGKFVTYVMAGLPVFGLCPEKSTISSIVLNNEIGQCCSDENIESVVEKFTETIAGLKDLKNSNEYFIQNHSIDYATTMLMEGK